MIQRLALRSSLLAVLAAALFAAPALAAPAVTGEFELQTAIDSNNKITTGPDGNIWVTLQGAVNNVARITPAGVIKEFKLEVEGASGITTGPDGLLWITRSNGLTSFSPVDPEKSKVQIPILAVTGNSPIVTGPDGRLWVATANKLLAINLATPTEPQDVKIPGGTLAPTDIDVAGSLIVVADFGGSRAVTSTTAGVTAEQKIGGGPQGVAGNPNGQYAISQPTTEPREFDLFAPGAAPIISPIPGKDAFGVALGSDGAYWAPELNSDGLVRMTATGLVSGISGFAKGSFPRQVTAGPGNTLWVTLEMTKKVGRVSGLEPPVSTPPSPPPAATATVPQTTLKSGPRGKLTTTKKFLAVKFGFNSPDTATTFECRIRKLAKKAGKKAVVSKAKAKVPKFKGCASPKGYKLRPGRYRFEVRAVNSGVVDPTPAQRAFRIVRVTAETR